MCTNVNATSTRHEIRRTVIAVRALTGHVPASERAIYAGLAKKCMDSLCHDPVCLPVVDSLVVGKFSRAVTLECCWIGLGRVGYV